MKRNRYLSSHIYFAISVICSLFIFFADTNGLFSMAYEPMFPSYIGGKTALCVFYLLISVIIYVFILFKKRIPVYISLSLLLSASVYIYIAPIFSAKNPTVYAASLFNSNGNLYITLKTSIEIILIIFAIIVFSLKNKPVKAILRIMAVIIPVVFIIFEFTSFAGLNPDDIPNLADKISASLFFDFLRFTPLSASVFLPSLKK